jgi:AAA15 family ATPase/GTPase
MKITRLSITNYKSFSTSANPVEDDITGLKNINMVYGYNNCGKSNLLKFIHLIFQSKVAKKEITVEGQKMETDEEVTFWRGPIINSPFIFHKNNRSNPITFKITLVVTHVEIKDSGFNQYKELSTLFSSTHDYATFFFEGAIRKVDDYDTAEMGLLKASINNKVIYSLDQAKRGVYFESTPKDNKLKSDSTAFLNLLSFFNNATLFLDNNRYLISEPIDKKIESFSALTFKNWLYNLSLSPRRNQIFEQLNSFIKKYKISPNPGNVDDSTFNEVEKNSPFANFNPEFAVLDDDTIEIMFKRGRDRFPLSSFGTGIQQLLYILTALYTSTARIILIEELELNLSPRYQRELFNILIALITDRKIDQVFFTTHSKYFDHRTDFSIYEVIITNQGVSKVRKANKTNKKLFFKTIE